MLVIPLRIERPGYHVIMGERFGAGDFLYFPILNEELLLEPQNPQNHDG